MKTKFFFYLFLILFLPLSAFSQTYVIGGINYNITSFSPPTVRVSSHFSSFSGAANIPESVIIFSTLYSVTSIGNQAFLNCTGLTSVSIPNSVTSIGNLSFQGCTSLTTVNIPSSVTSIGDSAFYNCTSLSTISFPNSLLNIGSLAFAYCTSLTSVNIPNSVTSIGNRIFLGCVGLTSVVLSNSITSIFYQSFTNCSNLTTINIPNSVTSIGDGAFTNCTNLSNVNLSNNLSNIGNLSFGNCTALTSINIPNTVNSIGSSAFENCTGLTSVTVNWLIPLIPSSEFIFTGVNVSNIPLIVPPGTQALYANAPVWQDFNIIGFCNQPDAPTASAQNFAPGATVAQLVATGVNLKWYEFADGGEVLSSDIPLATGTYFVTQTINDCESERTAVEVTIGTPGIAILRPDFCNTTLTTIDQQFFATRLTGFDTYIFEVKNMTTNQTVTVNRGNQTSFRLTQHAPSIVSFNTVYQVRVKASNVNEELLFGAICTITTPAIHGAIKLRQNNCGVTLSTLNQVIYSEITPLANEYTFEVKNIATNNVEEVISGTWFFQLTQLVQSVAYGDAFEVRVKSRVNGVYNSYGNICTITLPTLIVANLTALYCNQSFTSHRSLYANRVEQAQEYTFEVTNLANETIEVVRTVNFFHILYHTSTDFYGTGGSFNVRVKVKLNGNYGNYDQTCNVFFGVPVLLNHTNGHLSTVDKIEAYPNPFNDEFTIRLSNNDPASIQVFDMNGRLVEYKQLIESSEISMGQSLTTGVYIVSVEQNGETNSFKMVKK